MPFRNMTLDELAAHIGMDVREVRRLAESGRLPGQLVGGQWRFNRAQMLDWLQQELHTLSPRDIRNLERAMSDGDEELVVATRLAVEAIDLCVNAKSRASIIRELVRLAERTGLVYDAAGLVAALEEREALGSTALPGGLAFPHPRRPLPYATAEPLLAIARVPAGLHFGAPDRRTTDLFVLVVSHDEREHVKTLARLARLMGSELPDVLRELERPDEALAVILARERELLKERA
jgi:PTS system nitrogen regulatory IIA component